MTKIENCNFKWKHILLAALLGGDRRKPRVRAAVGRRLALDNRERRRPAKRLITRPNRHRRNVANNERRVADTTTK